MFGAPSSLPHPLFLPYLLVLLVFFLSFSSLLLLLVFLLSSLFSYFSSSSFTLFPCSPLNLFHLPILLPSAFSLPPQILSFFCSPSIAILFYPPFLSSHIIYLFPDPSSSFYPPLFFTPPSFSSSSCYPSTLLSNPSLPPPSIFLRAFSSSFCIHLHPYPQHLHPLPPIATLPYIPYPPPPPLVTRPAILSGREPSATYEV